MAGRPYRSALIRVSVSCFSTGTDGAAVTAERAVSFTAKEETEILLLDLREKQKVL